MVIGRVTQLVTTYVTQDVRWRTTNAMRGELAGHCLGLDMPFHNAQTPGGIIERIDGDVDVLSNFFSQFVIQILGNAVLLVGILVLLFREDCPIGASFLFFAVIVAAVLSKSVSITAPMWKAQRQASSELFGSWRSAWGYRRHPGQRCRGLRDARLAVGHHRAVPCQPEGVRRQRRAELGFHRRGAGPRHGPGVGAGWPL